MALACVGALLARASRRRRGSSARPRVAVGLGAAAKFAPLALAPLFAAARAARVRRRAARARAGAATVCRSSRTAACASSTTARSATRRAARRRSASGARSTRSAGCRPRSRRRPGLLALAAAFVPRRPDLRQVAALGAAILIAVELTATHWFYLYVVWFVPLVLVALFAALPRRCPSRRLSRSRSASRSTREARRACRAGAAGCSAGRSRSGCRRGPTSASTTCSCTATFAEPVLDGALPYRDVPSSTRRWRRPAIALPGLAGTGEEAYRWAFARLDARCWPRRWCCSAARWRARTGGDRAPGDARGRAHAAALRRAAADALRPRSRWRCCWRALLLLCRGRPARRARPCSALGAMTRASRWSRCRSALAWLVAREAGGVSAVGRAALACVARWSRVAALALAVSPGGALDAVRYHLDRPVQVESTPGARAARPRRGRARRGGRASRATAPTGSSTRPPTR